MRKSPWLFVVKAGTFLMTGTFLITGTFLMTGLSAVSAAQFDKVVEERKQLMKGIGGASKDMRSSADAAAVAASADKAGRQRSPRSMPTPFPREAPTARVPSRRSGNSGTSSRLRPRTP